MEVAALERNMEKVLRLRPTVLNRSWEFCARTKTEGKRALLQNSPEVPGTGGLRMPDLNTTEVAAPEHTWSAYTPDHDSSVLSLANIAEV